MYGMPMTKSIRYYCPLCLDAVGDLEDHFFTKHPTKQQVIPSGSEVGVRYQNLFPKWKGVYEDFPGEDEEIPNLN